MGDLGIFDIEIDTLETYGDTRIENARFQSSVSDEDLKTLIENQENVNTKGNTKWGINVFNKWREQRDINIPELYEMDTITMNYWLQRFIVEARRQDGAEYPLRSLYLIACGLLRYIRSNGVHEKNFLDEKNTNVVEFRQVLDAKMKTLFNKGLGCKVKQAAPITRDDEAKLWDMNVFGKDNAEQLQQTIFLYASKLFGLRGCDEHHDLQSEQFKVGVDRNKKIIRFVRRATQTYKGGLNKQLNQFLHRH